MHATRIHRHGGALGANGKDYYASLHRVAYYGDYTEELRHLAQLMGLRFVEEVPLPG